MCIVFLWRPNHNFLGDAVRITGTMAGWLLLRHHHHSGIRFRICNNRLFTRRPLSSRAVVLPFCSCVPCVVLYTDYVSCTSAHQCIMRWLLRRITCYMYSRCVSYTRGTIYTKLFTHYASVCVPCFEGYNSLRCDFVWNAKQSIDRSGASSLHSNLLFRSGTG